MIIFDITNSHLEHPEVSGERLGAIYCVSSLSLVSCCPLYLFILDCHVVPPRNDKNKKDTATIRARNQVK